jgi:protein TonB
MTFSGPAQKKEKANWLLRILVLISLGVHAVVFVHISGLYRSKVLSYIELTLENVSRPTARTIPRPRHRHPPPKPEEIEKLKIEPRPIPSFKPLKLEPAQAEAPDSLVESIAIPDLPSTPSLRLDQWSPPVIEDSSAEFATPASYFDIVRLKIERNKRYPEEARSRHIQGRVKVKFVITLQGDIRDPQVAVTSRHAALDAAALQAVKDSAPFPKPPRSLFKGEVPLIVTVVFELI